MAATTASPSEPSSTRPPARSVPDAIGPSTHSPAAEPAAPRDLLDGQSLGSAAFKSVGDELFGCLFRPENGWGNGPRDPTAIDYTPHLRRVHQGAAGGPDAFGCFSCHSKGGPDGSGTQTQNAF